MITKGNLLLHNDRVENGSTQINVHKVNTSWDSTNLSWMNKPSINNIIEEYKIVNEADKSYDFDITSIVKDWYATGINNGLMLKADDETKGYIAFHSSEWTNKPLLSIKYVDYSGLEGDWTYHSQEVLRAGYINDYNGNLVFIHNDLTMNGNRMPVSLNHIYNTNNIKSQIGYGSGWRLNLSQKVGPTGLSDGNDYYYIDEDGTTHYFNKNNAEGTYQDEGGLGLTLTVSSSGYTITDSQNFNLTFTLDGNLTTINDEYSNKIELSYNTSGQLISVMDGAGRVTVLDVAADGKLMGITDPSGRKTSYSYTGSQLTQITYPDGKVTKYTYDSANKLTSAANYDGYKITYTYSTGYIKRVIKISETDSNGTTGNNLSISYGFNKTTYTDAKGRTDSYQFNNEGKTISIKDRDNNAQYYEYGSGTNANKLVSQSVVQKTTINYIANHDIERASDFLLSNNGGTGSGKYDINNSYFGNQSLQITKSDNLNSQFYYQKYKLATGRSYTFSAYVRTQDISSNGKGAYISAWYRGNDGVIVTARSKYLSGNKEWTRLETTLTVPEGLTDNTVTIRMGIQSETGTANFDSLQLEDGFIASRYNLVQNGDFRGGSFDFWNKSGTDDTTDKLITDASAPMILDQNVFQMSGESIKEKRIYQSIPVSGNEGDSFVAGAWAKGSSVPLDEKRKFELVIEFIDMDGNAHKESISFNRDSNDWQYISMGAIAPFAYKAINIYGAYDFNENTVSFDGFRLYKEEFSQVYLVDIPTPSTETPTATPTPVSTPTPSASPTPSPEHDIYGNQLYYRTDGEDIYTQSNNTYSANGNYLKSSEDADGNTVEYQYDEKNGTLKSVTDGNGTVTNYTYDNMDRLQSVSKDTDGKTITNSYSYENDRLKSINHNGFSYRFDYDSYGNNTAVSVGSQRLITNSYEALTHNLASSTYGNGQKLQYQYDSLDRLNKVILNNNKEFNYQYDSEGNLAYLEDQVNNVGYRYYYDLNARLRKVDDTLENTTAYSYDHNSNLSRLSQRINGTDYSTKYLYNEEGRIQTVLFNSDLNNIYNKLDKNLIALYSFDQGDATDESGNGYDGTLEGEPTFVKNGHGKAIKLDGLDDWVNLTDFDIPETFSVSLRINPKSDRDGQAILGKNSKESDNIFLLGYWSGKSQLRIHDAVNTQADKITGYQHVVAVVKKISATQSKVKYYRDNQLLWETTMNAVIGNTGGMPWTLGQEYDNGSILTKTDFFEGEIDEVAFYNKELSSAEINELYNTHYGQNFVLYQYDSIGRLDSKLTSTGSYSFNTEYTYQNGVLKQFKQIGTDSNINRLY